MTTDESTLALALVKATFLPGSYDKRFAAAMAAHAALDSEDAITAKQRTCLIQMAVRYRRQLPQAVVKLAQRMQGEDQTQGLAPDGGPLGVINAGTCGNHVNPPALPG